jgi:hypothetical protein
MRPVRPLPQFGSSLSVSFSRLYARCLPTIPHSIAMHRFHTFRLVLFALFRVGCVPVADTIMPTTTSRLGVNGWGANESLARSPFPTSVWRLTHHQHPSQGCHCREMRCWLNYIFLNMFFNTPFCALCLLSRKSTPNEPLLFWRTFLYVPTCAHRFQLNVERLGADLALWGGPHTLGT